MKLENTTIETSEIEITSSGEVSEEKSMSMMLYDVRRMVKEIQNFTTKSRYRSLAITSLEEVENWMQKDLNTK